MSKYHVDLINSQLFRLGGDLPQLVKDLEYDESYREFDYRTKKIIWKIRKTALYQKVDYEGVYFRAGFAPFVYYHYMNNLLPDAKEKLKTLIYNDFSANFTDLRDYQIDDVKELLQYKRGIFSVYTGYGKTQIIAKLVEYIVKVRREKLIVIAPSNKALEEIQLRVRDVAGLRSGYFDYDSDYNAININGFLRSGSYNKTEPYWKEVKWIIADECEYCLTESAQEMIGLCENLEHAYAFSGTADKQDAARIMMREGLTDTVKRNKTLISYFGFSIVYKKPQGFDIDIIDIKTSIFNELSYLRISDDFIYSEIIKEIFINDKFCGGLRKIVEREKGGIYIPLGRLEVLYHWLKNVFTWKDGTIANICGDGIQIWSEGKMIKHISLDELKTMVENEEVEVVVGTQSSYRAIDLPKLNKIIPLTSQVASAVLQQIGRVARKRKFTIFNLIPTIYVSCYSNDLKSRNKLIAGYYSECNVRRLKRLESYYGIF